MWKRTIGRDMELEWEQWRKILTNLKSYGIESVEVFGGDALLRKDVIFNMISFCSHHCIETFFPTNSILIDKETAKNLVEAGLDNIYFSLDDVGEDPNHIRGIDDSFGKVKNAIETVIAARGNQKTPAIISITTISNLNYDRYELVVEFLKDYPINAMYPRMLGEFSNKNIESSVVDNIAPEPYFAASDSISHMLTKEQYNQFREIVCKLKQRKDIPYNNFRDVDMAPESAFTEGKYGIKKCHVCTTLVTISPLGDVIPCPFFPNYKLGNLCNDEIGSIWGNDRHKTFIRAQRDKKIAICENCNFRSFYPTLPETLTYYARRTKDRLGWR